MDRRLGRFENVNINVSNLIIILDKDRLSVYWNDFSPVLNDCRFGRSKYQIIKYQIPSKENDKSFILVKDPPPNSNDSSLGRHK